jgi:hypothetical protein
MSVDPGTQPAEGTRAIYTGDQPNPIFAFLQQPRIVLLMLAGWSVLGALTEAFTQNAIFFDNHGREIDGALGGFAFGWEGIPLAVLYVYCSRNPDRYPRVFWLAMIHMAAIAASQVYHLGRGDFTPESVVVPLVGSLALAGLSWVNASKSREAEA